MGRDWGNSIQGRKYRMCKYKGRKVRMGIVRVGRCEGAWEPGKGREE